MPTPRSRYTVTDADGHKAQCDKAQRHWAEIRDRKKLMLPLVAAGGEAIERAATNRGAAARETAGRLTGIFRSGELARARDDRPA